MQTDTRGSGPAPEPPAPPAPAKLRALDAFRTWTARRRLVAAAGAVVTALAIGLPTDVIPNPVFGRPVPVEWWAPWVLALTAVLGGLLIATYVRDPLSSAAGPGDPGDSAVPAVAELDRPGRAAGVGGLLSFFAVGCPVCNKLVVLALGTTGALELFAPLQPLLAVGSAVLLAVALRARLRGQLACPLPTS